MFPACAVTASADEVACGSSSAQFTTIIAMAPGQYFVYCANVASWIKQAANPTASAAAGSMFVPAGVQVMLDGRNGIKLATIDDGSAGKASLTPVLV